MEDEAHKVTGGCLCGAVRYDAEVYLKQAQYCHCRTCQRSSGAPVEIGVLVRPGTLAFTKDDPKTTNPRRSGGAASARIAAPASSGTQLTGRNGPT
jgi:hypothetical protein